MSASFTLREGLVVAGLGLLCTATGIAMLAENPASASVLSVAEAVDLFRLWARI